MAARRQSKEPALLSRKDTKYCTTKLDQTQNPTNNRGTIKQDSTSREPPADKATWPNLYPRFKHKMCLGRAWRLPNLCNVSSQENKSINTL